MKHLLQNKVWNECIVCSLGTDSAMGPSMFGVHSGGRMFGSNRSVNSIYLKIIIDGVQDINFISFFYIYFIISSLESYFSLS